MKDLDSKKLRHIAFQYLSHFSASEKTFRDMLERRVARWVYRKNNASKEQDMKMHMNEFSSIIDDIIGEMKSLSLINDEEFSFSRVRKLRRSGSSYNEIIAYMNAHGVTEDLVKESLENNSSENILYSESELGAALILSYKRKIGPFQRLDRPQKEEKKILSLFARHGFSYDIAKQVMSMDRQEAEEIIVSLRKKL